MLLLTLLLLCQNALDIKHSEIPLSVGFPAVKSWRLSLYMGSGSVGVFLAVILININIASIQLTHLFMDKITDLLIVIASICPALYEALLMSHAHEMYVKHKCWMYEGNACCYMLICGAFSHTLLHHNIISSLIYLWLQQKSSLAAAVEIKSKIKYIDGQHYFTAYILVTDLIWQ